MLIEFVLMAAAGGGLLSLGVYGLRTRSFETGISPIEAAVLKVTGDEPLPLTDRDRAWGHATAWASAILGAIVLLLGLLLAGITLFEAE
jgi:hypothetical protein